MRTLHTYLARDLAKATVLSCIAFTLVLTVFVILEPLRERGLSGRQALTLFGYTMPAMLSLTLPIAALFAATIVYGRFSQDNELMACRASGIATLVVLKPAIWLGAVVTALALVLGLYVAPRLLWMSRNSITTNLRDITYHALQTRHYIKQGSGIVHVDRVDPQSGWMAGVVGADLRDPEDARVVVAAKAKLDFLERDGNTLYRFQPEDPAVFSQSGGMVGLADQQRIQRGELPNMFADEPKLYDWDQLCRTWSQPKENSVVRDKMLEIRQQLCVQEFYRELIALLGAQGQYDRLAQFVPPGAEPMLSRVALYARQAALSDDGQEVILGPVVQAAPATTSATASAPTSAPARTAVASQLAGEKPQRHFWASNIRIRAEWDSSRKAPVVNLVFQDVDIQDASDSPNQVRHRDQYELGPFAVPEDIALSTQAVTLDDLFDNPHKYESTRRVKVMIWLLHNDVVARLLAKVQSEMHQRLAYGLSCMLMVMLGAALGLIYRGGQVLAAFAISAVPASFFIIMLLMGKQLIANIHIPPVYGIAVVWGSIAVLAAAAAYVYAVPMRR